MKFIIALLSLCLSVEAFASDWLERLGDLDVRNNITSVYAKANVTVSDGLQYKVETIWLDQERAIFHREYPERRATMGREGHLYWSYDGDKQTDLSKEYRHFITGHQYHAQLLFPDQFDAISEAVISNDTESDYSSESMTDVDGNIISIHYEPQGLPTQQVTETKRFGKILTEYKDWRVVAGVKMPHNIIITHDGRVFNYQYESIVFNQPQHFRRLSADMEQLTDAQQIMRLHRQTMDAHIASDASIMQDNWADNILIVNRGEHIETTGEAAAHRMSISLAQRRHSRYIDLVMPNVTVSQDGTMGWLAVQIYAEGETVGNDPRQFNFTSAWIATFSKIGGAWKMTANASNFKAN